MKPSPATKPPSNPDASAIDGLGAEGAVGVVALCTDSRRSGVVPSLLFGTRRITVLTRLVATASAVAAARSGEVSVTAIEMRDVFSGTEADTRSPSSPTVVFNPSAVITGSKTIWRVAMML